MSFSSKVKSELMSEVDTPEPRHCGLAEMNALLAICGSLDYGGVSISTENRMIARRFYGLMFRTFARVPRVSAAVAVMPGKMRGRRVFACSISAEKPFVRAVASRLLDESLLSRECCKRAYVRGAFLACGSLSDPHKHYHLEFVNQDKGVIIFLRDTISHFDIDMRITLRKSAHVLYVKDGERISWLLNIIGAHKSLMELENVRILKEVRNNINRRVNFETANLSKTVSAAVSQMADIKYILESGEFGLLSQSLADVAKLRLEYPSASLQEIGEMLSPAISKSAINHRLRKISSIAEKLRGE
ncbi:MAG: DNA-binding protein WhiA [Defluviitaleaceae bacterium]|nr:DNA-binding protein WhiA [Defluviitaleaceae bacterium]